MTKIMLVEDDNNLREIYEARLLAEGYEIVSAKDGEEALAMAVKEKPDLIISDVMMPKISGFDMLDILRSTPETTNTKVIMMTALSQAEDKTRADKLGADRYLVKSQVTLEDVARVAREVLNGEEETPSTPTTPSVAAATAAPSTDSTPSVVVPAPEPTTAVSPLVDSPTVDTASAPLAVPDTPSPSPQDIAPTAAEETATVESNISQFVQQPTAAEENAVPIDIIEPTPAPGETSPPPPTGVVEAPSADPASSTTTTNDVEDKDDAPIAKKKVIAPINDLNQKSPDINDLLAKEQQKAVDSPVAENTTLAPDSIVQPGGATVTPASPDVKPTQDQPGNIVHPGSDPGSIAL